MIPGIPLRGLSLDRVRLYGMPHVELSGCAGCHGPADNRHHVVPKGMGGGSKSFILETPRGKFVLFSPTVTLCGMGNASGCHGEAHSGLLRFEWQWDDEEVEERWWSGWLLTHGYAPHDPRLYRHGCWRVLRDKLLVREVRL